MFLTVSRPFPYLVERNSVCTRTLRETTRTTSYVTAIGGVMFPALSWEYDAWNPRKFYELELSASSGLCFVCCGNRRLRVTNRILLLQNGPDHTPISRIGNGVKTVSQGSAAAGYYGVSVKVSRTEPCSSGTLLTL